MDKPQKSQSIASSKLKESSQKNRGIILRRNIFMLTIVLDV